MRTARSTASRSASSSLSSVAGASGGRQRSKTSHSRSVPSRRPTPTRPEIHSRCSSRAIVWRPETSSVHQPWRHGSAERSSSSRARSGPRSRSSSTSSSQNSALALRNVRARTARAPSPVSIVRIAQRCSGRSAVATSDASCAHASNSARRSYAACASATSRTGPSRAKRTSSGLRATVLTGSSCRQPIRRTTSATASGPRPPRGGAVARPCACRARRRAARSSTTREGQIPSPGRNSFVSARFAPAGLDRSLLSSIHCV